MTWKPFTGLFDDRLRTEIAALKEQVAQLESLVSRYSKGMRENLAEALKGQETIAQQAEAIRLKDAALDWCIGEFNLRLDDIDLSQETIRVLSARRTQPSPEILKDKNVQLDFHTNAPGTKQQRELDGEMAMGQLLENSKDKEAGNSSIKGKLILKDTFRGDTDSLLESAIALLELDNDHALVPHGIGGHANAIITSLVLRMKARDERVAEACAKLVNRFISGDGILNDTWVHEIEDAIRSGEWRKYL